LSKGKKHNTQKITFLSRTGLIIACVVMALLLYGNTLTHKYTQDDAIVIYQNSFVKKGLSGIPDILKTDTFHGFFNEAKDGLVTGGRYRPLSLIMFATGWQLFGENPMIGHLINILCYALLAICIFLLIELLFKYRFTNKERLFFATLTTALFIAHPLHTEVVANIKGRDEILSMLGSVTGLYFLVKAVDHKKIQFAILSSLCFFLGLMSKENAITFLAIAPLTMYFFRKMGVVASIKYSVPLFASGILFLIIRTSILGFDMGSVSGELMNNPFLKIENGIYAPFSASEKTASIVFVLGKYLQLLVAPISLTHDYYPRSIGILSLSNWKVILSLLLHIGLLIFAILGLRKRNIISYGILFYILTISIASNIVFPIGTNMSERFMFMPSLGFVLILAFGFYKILQRCNTNLYYVLPGILLLLYSAKTITRNQVWKDDYTLFTTDVKTSPNSAKILNAAGGAIQTKYANTEKSPERTAKLNEAIGYLNRATTIHPNYKNAYLLKGNCQFYLGKFEESIHSYNLALQLDPNYAEAKMNQAVAYRDAGKYQGQQRNDINKAKEYLYKSYRMNAQDQETVRLLGVVHGVAGEHLKAVEYFTKLTQLMPDNATSYLALSTAYRNAGNSEQANLATQKALELDPNALLKK